MDDRQRRPIRKWLVLGGVGSIGGLIMLLVFRSIPMAAGTAAATVVTIIALKHLALFIVVGSPAAALFKFVQPRVRAYCPWAPEDTD